MARHYDELAVLGGDVTARHNLGVIEDFAGNIDMALKHYMIAAGGGFAESLTKIQKLYSNEHATKDDYTKAITSLSSIFERDKE